MDKKNYIPEEEAYLRMLDREVPDLWGRIEAGLDAAQVQGGTPAPIQAAATQTTAQSSVMQTTAAFSAAQTAAPAAETREQRFLAEQQAANVVAFDTADRKTKSSGKRKIWVGAGLAAAAAVLVISLAVFGFSQRDSKKETKSDIKNAASMDTAESSDESMKSESSKTPANLPADLELGDITSLNPQQDRNASKGDASYSSAVVEDEDSAEQSDAKEELSGAESEIRSADGAEMIPKQTFYQAKLGLNMTIKELAESLSVGEQATVYRKVDGQYKAYRICRITYEGNVEVVPDELADTIKNKEEYEKAIIIIEGATQVMASKDIIDGKIVLYIP